MDREIIFRGKRLDNGEWVYGAIICQDDRYFINPQTAGTVYCNSINGRWIFGDYLEVDPATVGQYTGLTDKNGTKIFEGDILSIWKSKVLVAVRFSTDYDLSWECVSKNVGKNYQHRLEYKNAKYEVVGNIYDNPELLKMEE